MLKKLLCGIYHENEVYNVVNIEELTGKQQDYLSRFDELDELKERYKDDPEKLEEAVNNISIHSHIPLIISDLVTDLQNSKGEIYSKPTSEWMYDVPAEDVILCIKEVRSSSYGKKWVIPVLCQKCQNQQQVIIDLDDIKIKSIKPKKSTKKIITPKDKHEVILKLRSIRELLVIERLFVDHRKEMFTKSTGLSIESINGEKATKELIQSMKAKDLDFIREEIKKFQETIDIDTNIEHTCEGEIKDKDGKISKCSEELIIPMPILEPRFFDQSLTPITGFPKSMLPTELI